MTARLGLVDYGTGNYTSVLNALGHIGADPLPIQTPADLAEVSHVVLPGVGAYAACMRRLEAANLVEPLKQRLDEGSTPFLGICVGMQMLATVGREFEDYPGLDVIAGEVRRVPAEGVRLPHVGWNDVEIRAGEELFAGLGERPNFYFVHSYELVPEDPGAVAAVCDYAGGVTAAVAHGPVYGVQFHPEKSQQAGLQLLRNFVGLPC